MKKLLTSLILILTLLSDKSFAQSSDSFESTFKVETEEGYFHVNSNGVYDGPYMIRTTYPNGSILTTSGFRKGTKNVGRKLIKLNGQTIAIRYYDSNGILIKSVRIRPKGCTDQFATN